MPTYLNPQVNKNWYSSTIHALPRKDESNKNQFDQVTHGISGLAMDRKLSAIGWPPDQ